MPLPTAGSAAPPFSLQASVSGRMVTSRPGPGQRLVLVFHGATSTQAPKDVNNAVRERFPSAKEVLIASVVDLKAMAGLWRRVAEAQIKASFEKLSQKVKAQDATADPADYIVVCADWENAVGPLFGIDESDRSPTVVVIGPDGRVAGCAQGADLAKQTLALLAI